MLKFAVLSIVVFCVDASGYGGYGSGGGYGGHSVEAAIYSKSRRDIIPVHNQVDKAEPTYVNVPGGVLPVYLNFESQSSPVHVSQRHQGSKGSSQNSKSEDEPHKLLHEVTKPVIQEVREVIVPRRKVVQVIKPVEEEVLTLVHRGEGGYGNGGGNDGGYGGSLGGYGGSEYSSEKGSYASEGYDSGKGLDIGYEGDNKGYEIKQQYETPKYESQLLSKRSDGVYGKVPEPGYLKRYGY